MSHLHLAPAGVGVVGRGACLLTVALEAGERADEAVGAAQPLLALLLLLLLLLLRLGLGLGLGLGSGLGLGLGLGLGVGVGVRVRVS